MKKIETVIRTPFMKTNEAIPLNCAYFYVSGNFSYVEITIWKSN